MKRIEAEGEELRGLLRGAGSGRKGYSSELRRRVVEHARRAQAGGEGIVRTARRLGISPTTLRAWRRAEGEAFVPIAVVDEPAKAVAVLVSPTGWRLEVDARGLRALVLGS